ncbi:MAG: hypothetical protein KGK35_01365, partial [Xanthomonadaceae bacterium]|nr:hypothetical protein [Xanthomonadaceae bacterium]
MSVSRLAALAASVALALPAATLALPAAAASTSSAAGTRSMPFGALHWRLIGPFRAGRTLAVTGVVGQPNHFYMGA